MSALGRGSITGQAGSSILNSVGHWKCTLGIPWFTTKVPLRTWLPKGSPSLLKWLKFREKSQIILKLTSTCASENCMFTKHSENITNTPNFRKRLTKDSIPTLFNIPNAPKLREAGSGSDQNSQNQIRNSI